MNMTEDYLAISNTGKNITTETGSVNNDQTA